MGWLVDSCVLLDVLDSDSAFGRSSAAIIDEMVGDGLFISPVTAIEIAPAFLGDSDRQEQFLWEIGVSISDCWDDVAQRAAQSAWAAHIAAKRRGLAPKRTVADILIGALALRHDGLITRNATDFRRHFPSLNIRVP